MLILSPWLVENDKATYEMILTFKKSSEHAVSLVLLIFNGFFFFFFEVGLIEEKRIQNLGTVLAYRKRDASCSQWLHRNEAPNGSDI